MIQVTQLAFSYGEKPLYKEVGFIVGKGQKVGLVGPNGSGKSTLLKILTGQEEGYTGKVVVIGKVSIVPQEVKNDPIMENSESVVNYVDPQNVIDVHTLRKMFSGLELKIDLAAIPSKLSGGQKTKLALARALLEKPDILLLDEPTNFMDTAGKKWVMDFLSRYEGTVIVISHDLELMNRAIDKVLAVNPVASTIEEYKGNYTLYQKLKKEREERIKREIIVRQKHIKQMEEGLTKMVRFTSGKGVRRRVQQQKRIAQEKLDLPIMPFDLKSIKVSLPEPPKSGQLPLQTNNISKSYGDLVVLKNIDFTILRGERIALIGVNGAGKSTFIKILLGMVQPDSGQVKINEQIKIGYYSQEFEAFDFSKTVINHFCTETKKDEGFARSFLGRFMLGGDKVFQRIETLSGGEKTRLSIAVLTAKGNNLLVLDEPTTYLDVMSQRVILESLKQYKGTMIIVSHTPEFISELAPQKAYLFPEERMVYWDEKLVERISNL